MSTKTTESPAVKLSPVKVRVRTFFGPDGKPNNVSGKFCRVDLEKFRIDGSVVVVAQGNDLKPVQGSGSYIEVFRNCQSLVGIIE